MLGDPLSRHVQVAAEFAERLSVFGGEPIEQKSPMRVSQRFEHLVEIIHGKSIVCQYATIGLHIKRLAKLSASLRSS